MVEKGEDKKVVLEKKHASAAKGKLKEKESMFVGSRNEGGGEIKTRFLQVL